MGLIARCPYCGKVHSMIKVIRHLTNTRFSYTLPIREDRQAGGICVERGDLFATSKTPQKSYGFYTLAGQGVWL